MKYKIIPIAVFLLFLVICPAYGKGPVVIRLVVPTPAGDMLTVKDQELADNFNRRANGEYEIRVYPGESIVKVSEYLDAVRVGAIEMADTAWGIYAGHDKRLGAMEMPFLFNNINASIEAAGKLLPIYDELLSEKFNQKALALFAIGGMELISTRPVKTLSDWKGLMTGAINPQISALTRELGGAPVVVIWTDLYTSLQKKVIDAGLSNTHQMLTFSLTDVCSNVSIFYGASGWQGYSINMKVWKKMPEHIKTILMDETAKAAEKMHEKFLRLHDEDIEDLKKKGLNVKVVSPEERAVWAERLQTYIKKEISAMGEFGQKIKKISDEINEKHPY
ncbi:MAG: TRAP transporter substrate-binding protein [Deltaproteobacteria bacterium]|nr:TRAP transporter substrate-binding protein [Deltaproteobacteria bacterium]